VIRCARHANEQDTENSETRQTTKPTNRTAEYSAKELLILSQAYIKASENSVEGAARRLSKFWDDVSDNYRELKKQQEEYDNRQRKHKQYNERSLYRAGFAPSMLDEDSDEDVAGVPLPPRTSSSLQQKWSKFVQPHVTKFISLTIRFPRLSGEDKERYYNRIHLIFLEQVPEVKSFDLYRPSWEFLENSPKFASITTANAAAQKSLDGKKKVSPDDAINERPVGKKKTKRLAEEQKIIESVTDKLKGQVNNGSAGQVLAAAIGQITELVASGLQEWKDQRAYMNASQELKQQYDDLILRARIQQLQQNLKPAHHALPPMTPVALGDSMLDTPTMLNAEADVEELDNYDDSDYISSEQVESHET
jgi:hypothetical protein